MTLRDYFAAQCVNLAAQCADSFSPKNVARYAYIYADAMLAERENDGVKDLNEKESK
jgi:hypothetical protein